MLKTFFTILLALCFTLDIQAQKLNVESFVVKPNDITARTQPRKDINGNDCALVMVHTLKKGIEFDGWVVGNVDYKDGIYWVYMANGAKHLKIKHPDYPIKDLIFNEYGVNSLKEDHIYLLYLEDNTKDIINYVYSKGWNLDDTEIPKNVMQILRTAADRGDKNAMIALAQLMTIKEGNSSQNEHAYYWVEKLLSKGDSSCLEVMPGELMYIYAKRQKSKIWREIDKDTEKMIYTDACQYEIKACLKGYKKAVNALFLDFPKSNGVPEGCDYLKQICLDSANIGNIQAKRCLGFMYEEGLCVKQDLSLAANWYEKVNKAKSTSQSKADLCRIFGNKNYPIDTKSLDFINKCAIENNPEAIFQLGLMYEEGRNYPKDINKAIEYYLKISPEKSYQDRHPRASCRLAEYYFNRKEYEKARSFVIGLNDDDALYWEAVINYYQYDYTDDRIRVLIKLNSLSKKGYQKATDFIKSHY